MPGDPASLMLGDLADEASLADLRRNGSASTSSLPIQFAIWFGNVLAGRSRPAPSPPTQAVLPLVLERFWISAKIVLVAVFFASLVAVPAGMIAAWRQNSALDLALVDRRPLLLSIPDLLAWPALLLFFGLKLDWLPVVGYVSFSDDPWRGAALSRHASADAVPARDRRAACAWRGRATLEVLRLDYITHARAKGLSESAVLWRHAFKNAFGRPGR